MKKLLSLLMVGIMLLGTMALAEEPQDPDLDTEHIVVVNTTGMNGNFFNNMFGNNTADLDVQRILHDYDLVMWDTEVGGFKANDSVVSGVSVTENGLGDRTFTLALYRDLFYSDGTPITAWDYAFSILLSASPEMAAIGAAIKDSNAILGMNEYIAGEADTISGVAVAGDYLLSVTIRHEFRPFFYEMGLLSYCPYPISQIAPDCIMADDGTGIYIGNREAFTAETLERTLLDPATGYVSHPAVTSGAYKLVSFDGVTVELEANPYYKGNKDGMKPAIPYITFTLASNEDVIEKLADGDVGLLNKCVSAETIRNGIETLQDADLSMSSYVRNGLSYVSFCCERPGISEQAVRQAIAMCMDKENVVKGYVGDYGLSVDGFYGIGQWLYQLVDGTSPAPLEPLPENATPEQIKAYEEAGKKWEELNLDGLKKYELDTVGAEQLLENAGWTLNKAGQPFVKGTDEVRCKVIDGELVPLELTLIYPDTNKIGEIMEENFATNLAEAGIQLNIVPVTMTELLDIHYRRTERNCDMIYLATNFSLVYDPSSMYAPGNDMVYNVSALQDEKLYDLAVDMNHTEPGDLLTYCQKWITFQEYWTEVLPAIPVYSNAYFDFYTSKLQDYQVGNSITWGEALVSSYIGDPVDEYADEIEFFTGEEIMGGEIVILEEENGQHTTEEILEFN